MTETGGFMAGAVVGKFLLDKSDWDGKFRAVREDAQRLGGTASELGKRFQKVGLGITAAGAAITGAIGALVKKTADAGDAVFDMAQRTGVSTRVLSSYKLAAEQAGSSLDGLATGFRGLSSRMMDAKNGLTESKRAFETLGVEVMDSAGALRPMNDVLLDVADRFAGMKDGAEKAALAQDVFGRSGMELIPLLNSGRKGLEEAARQAERLGLVFDEKAARASDAFNDALAELKGSFAGLAKETVVSLLPVVRDLAARVTDTVAKVTAWVRENPALVEGIGKAALAVGGVLAVVGPLNLALGTTLTLIPRIAAVASALVSPLGLAAAAIAGVGFSIATLVKNHSDALEVMRRTAALAAADTKDNMLAVAAVQVRASAMGGEALEQWNALAFKFGKDFRAIFDELQTNPAYGTLKRILDDAKSGLEAAARAGAGLGEVIIRTGAALVGTNEALGGTVRLVETALPPAREFNVALGLWSTRLVDGILPAARQLPAAIQEGLMAPLAAATEAGNVFFSSMSSYFMLLSENIGAGISAIISDLKRLVFEEVLAAHKSVLAKQMESVAAYISSVFKKVPFPLNIVLAAGGFALVSKLFSKLTKFAKGAAFEKPTLIQNAIAGEAGPEYLLPEKKLTALVRDAMTAPRLGPVPAPLAAAAGAEGGAYHIVQNNHFRSLDRRTVHEAGELLFEEARRQARRTTRKRN